MKKIVGKVTEEEKRLILDLNNHKNSLNELLLILPIDSDLHKRASADLENTVKKYQEWWNMYSRKYNWESAKNGNWEISFETNEIYLKTTEN